MEQYIEKYKSYRTRKLATVPFIIILVIIEILIGLGLLKMDVEDFRTIKYSFLLILFVYFMIIAIYMSTHIFRTKRKSITKYYIILPVIPISWLITKRDCKIFYKDILTVKIKLTNKNQIHEISSLALHLNNQGNIIIRTNKVFNKNEMQLLISQLKQCNLIEE